MLYLSKNVWLPFAYKVLKERNFHGLKTSLYSSLYLSCWVLHLYSNRIWHDFPTHRKISCNSQFLWFCFGWYTVFSFDMCRIRKNDKGILIPWFLVCVLSVVTMGRLCSPLCPLNSPSLSLQSGCNRFLMLSLFYKVVKFAFTGLKWRQWLHCHLQWCFITSNEWHTEPTM